MSINGKILFKKIAGALLTDSQITAELGNPNTEISFLEELNKAGNFELICNYPTAFDLLFNNTNAMDLVVRSPQSMKHISENDYSTEKMFTNATYALKILNNTQYLDNYYNHYSRLASQVNKVGSVLKKQEIQAVNQVWTRPVNLQYLILIVYNYAINTHYSRFTLGRFDPSLITDDLKTDDQGISPLDTLSFIENISLLPVLTSSVIQSVNYIPPGHDISKSISNLKTKTITDLVWSSYDIEHYLTEPQSLEIVTYPYTLIWVEG